MNIVPASLAEAKTKTLNNTLVDMKALKLNNRVTNTLVQAEVWTLGDILTTIKDKALVDTLANMLQKRSLQYFARHWSM